MLAKVSSRASLLILRAMFGRKGVASDPATRVKSAVMFIGYGTEIPSPPTSVFAVPEDMLKHVRGD